MARSDCHILIILQYIASHNLNMKISKRYSEAVIRNRTDITMVKRKKKTNNS
jgi:hypothetical protein